jgi:hypothetical protein
MLNNEEKFSDNGDRNYLTFAKFLAPTDNDYNYNIWFTAYPNGNQKV